MSWGPIHIVQRFQDSEAVRPERVVLVGAVSVSTEPGRVHAYRWLGGKLPINATQERVYEAVTGIIDIENTLAIGEYFGIWPDECFVVEADMPADTFGRLVMADNDKRTDDFTLQRQVGFSPRRMCQDVAAIAAALAIEGRNTRVRYDEKVATALRPNAKFMRNRFAHGTQENGLDG